MAMESIVSRSDSITWILRDDASDSWALKCSHTEALHVLPVSDAARHTTVSVTLAAL